MHNVDEIFMRRALQLATAGRAQVSPNPMVGAVIVSDKGKIIGEGFHRRFGGPHAEVNAVNSVADSTLLKNATIYVTLEPCSHYGKTPPCAQLLIKCRFRRVVIGSRDPFPAVSGRGIDMLRQAGIEVSVGVLQEECEALNKHFITAHRLQRPFVQLKWAQSSDGFIDGNRTGNTPAGISTPLTSLLMHRQRAVADAILIGAGTARLDNPALTTRLWPCRKSPLRVLLDARLSTPSGCKLFTDGLPTLVYNLSENSQNGAVGRVLLDTSNLADMLADLYRRGITSLMVEGGANVLQQLIDNHLWDEARVEIGDIILNYGVKAPHISGSLISSIEVGNNRIEWLANNSENN